MFTNCGSFNKGAVISGNKYNQMQYSSGSKAYTLGGHLCTMSHFILMFTNCGSFNEGAVVSGNTDETSIYSSGSKVYRLGGQLCKMSHFIDVH